MSEKLLIVGAGGHGCVVADAARASGEWSDIAFVDDQYPRVSRAGEWLVLGNRHTLEQLRDEFKDVVIAIGDSDTRLHLQAVVERHGFQLATIVHPSAVVGGNVQLGRGTVVFAGAVINYGATIGCSCIINTSSTIDHDCVLGDGVHVSPGANLAGGVCIGDKSWIGISASVVEQITIGSGAKVGAGAVVVGGVEDETTVVGVPAKRASYE